MLDLVEGEISMDAEARWLGNASCTLSVATIMGVSCPVQVHSCHLRSNFIVHIVLYGQTALRHQIPLKSGQF